MENKFDSSRDFVPKNFEEYKRDKAEMYKLLEDGYEGRISVHTSHLPPEEVAKIGKWEKEQEAIRMAHLAKLSRS